jgi:hypothetical protein
LSISGKKRSIFPEQLALQCLDEIDTWTVCGFAKTEVDSKGTKDSSGRNGKYDFIFAIGMTGLIIRQTKAKCLGPTKKKGCMSVKN